MNFFTADPHFGHANIIKYCQRPFANVEEMDRVLTERWNAKIGSDDDVWILGDLTMRSGATALNYLRQLNGHKHLILGNHDGFAPSALVANSDCMPQPSEKFEKYCEEIKSSVHFI